MSALLSWLDPFFQSAITVDDEGLGHNSVTEIVADSDPKVQPRDILKSAATTTATPLDVPLFTIAAGEVWSVDVNVTVVGVAKRARIKITALVWGDGSTATLEADPGLDIITNDAAITATVVVAGPNVSVELTGIALALTWGINAHGQRQAI